MVPESPLDQVDHRPWPLPTRPWLMRQNWNELLFAHWPVPAAMVAPYLPQNLDVDTFDGEAWLGVVPFWMDGVQVRVTGQMSLSVPSVRRFSELNLRTYVRSLSSGKQGVFFFSLDCSSPLAVIGARIGFHLPYYFASMQRTGSEDVIQYRSRRVLAAANPSFEATFGPVGEVTHSRPGSLEAFLTERYCLFTSSFGRLLRGDVHHRPWPLQAAEAELRRNEIPVAHGLALPDVAPVLHFSRRLEVYIWSLVVDG